MFLIYRHLTLFEEMELLKEFEKRESNFTGKYRAKKQEKSEMETKVIEPLAQGTIQINNDLSEHHCFRLRRLSGP